MTEGNFTQPVGKRAHESVRVPATLRPIRLCEPDSLSVRRSNSRYGTMDALRKRGASHHRRGGRVASPLWRRRVQCCLAAGQSRSSLARQPSWVSARSSTDCGPCRGHWPQQLCKALRASCNWLPSQSHSATSASARMRWTGISNCLNVSAASTAKSRADQIDQGSRPAPHVPAHRRSAV